MIPFQPENRLNMVGWMAANSDPDGYGELVAFTLPAGRDVDGPGLVFARVNSDQEFSAARTLLGTGGSRVLFGDLLAIPIEESILYVLPVYVRAARTRRCRSSSCVGGERIDRDAGALTCRRRSRSRPAPSRARNREPPDGGGGEGTVEQQIERAADAGRPHFAAAEEALRAGDLATYQSEQEQAQALVEQATELLAGGSGGRRRAVPVASSP